MLDEQRQLKELKQFAEDELRKAEDDLYYASGALDDLPTALRAQQCMDLSDRISKIKKLLLIP